MIWRNAQKEMRKLSRKRSAKRNFGREEDEKREFKWIFRKFREGLTIYWKKVVGYYLLIKEFPCMSETVKIDCIILCGSAKWKKILPIIHRERGKAVWLGQNPEAGFLSILMEKPDINLYDISIKNRTAVCQKFRQAAESILSVLQIGEDFCSTGRKFQQEQGERIFRTVKFYDRYKKIFVLYCDILAGKLKQDYSTKK